MAYTQLSPAGIPGQRYSFLAKAGAAAGKGIGPFTELSVIGLPGRIHSFSAKTAAVASEKGVGLFTWLSPYGVPGGRYSFVAKTAAEVPEEIFYPPAGGVGGGGGLIKAGFRRPIDDRAYAALQDENDVITVLMIALGSGIIH